MHGRDAGHARRTRLKMFFTGMCLLLTAPLFAEAPVPTLAASSVKAPARRLPAEAVQSVFHIEKSENKNQVHYAVQVDEACRPIGKHPVYGFWRDLEEGPRAVSNLLRHEQPAYGLTEPRYIHTTQTGGEIRISLRGFPDRPLTIQTFKIGKGCGARAMTTIKNQPAMLTSIYVEIGFLFSVDYAIVRGLRISDGVPVQEKVND